MKCTILCFLWRKPIVLCFYWFMLDICCRVEVLVVYSCLFFSFFFSPELMIIFYSVLLVHFRFSFPPKFGQILYSDSLMNTKIDRMGGKRLFVDLLFVFYYTKRWDECPASVIFKLESDSFLQILKIKNFKKKLDCKKKIHNFNWKYQIWWGKHINN